MTIEEIKNHCARLHKDSRKAFRDVCAKCDYWSSTKGCRFYARPIDWQIKEVSK